MFRRKLLNFYHFSFLKEILLPFVSKTFDLILWDFMNNKFLLLNAERVLEFNQFSKLFFFIDLF